MFMLYDFYKFDKVRVLLFSSDLQLMINKTIRKPYPCKTIIQRKKKKKNIKNAIHKISFYFNK